MDLTEAPRGDRPFVERYGPGGFRISGEQWRGSVLVMADRVVAWDGTFDPAKPQPLIDAFSSEGAELLIVGFGNANQLLPRAAREDFKAAGLSVEGMDTGAACRTYNLLAGEGRAVGAALIALPEG